MTPQIQYLLMMAQRFGNTPVGQWFSSQAQRAMDAARIAETKWPTMSRGAAGQFPARTAADKIPVAPFSRGAAGLAGVGAVGAGSGQFEGVRSRLFSELDARGGAGGAPEPAYDGSAARRLSGEMLAAQPEPGYDGSAARRLSGEMLAMQPEPGYGMPPAARAAERAVRVARSVMPSNPPLQPPRPAEAVPAASGPSARDLWDRYNETGSAADFVRADMATPRLPREGRADGGGIPEGMMGMRGMQPMDLPPMDLPPMPDVPMPSGPDMGSAPDLGPSPTPKPAGAGAGGRDAAINKALEIIHHLVIRRP